MTVQVQEFSSPDELMAHYRALEKRRRNAYSQPRPAAVVLPIKPQQPQPAPQAPAAIDERPHVYAWPIGPRHERDVLYIATPVVVGGVQTAQNIIREVAQKHGVKILDLKSPRRQTKFVRARQECFYRLKHETHLSYPHMGKLLGHRDHTTALHSVQRWTDLLAEGIVE